MAIVKPKYDPPVRANRDAPETLQPAFERMKPEAGKFHIRRYPGAVKDGEDVFNLLDHIGLEPSTFAVNKKSLESLVSKILDHAHGAGSEFYLTVTSCACQSCWADLSDGSCETQSRRDCRRLENGQGAPGGAQDKAQRLRGLVCAHGGRGEALLLIQV
jgi:hypothetical protein